MQPEIVCTALLYLHSMHIQYYVDPELGAHVSAFFCLHTNSKILSNTHHCAVFIHSLLNSQQSAAVTTMTTAKSMTCIVGRLIFFFLLLDVSTTLYFIYAARILPVSTNKYLLQHAASRIYFVFSIFFSSSSSFRLADGFVEDTQSEYYVSSLYLSHSLPHTVK